MGSSRSSQSAREAERHAALALAYFMASYNWPLRVPTRELPLRELWHRPDEQLAGLLKLPKGEIHQLEEFRRGFSVEQTLEDLEHRNITFISLGDKEYPHPLAQIHDPPPALFALGKVTPPPPLERGKVTPPTGFAPGQVSSLADFMQRPRVAIVGSRAATRYGIDAATGIARELAQQGVCIISGMAYGIDAAAHRASLAEAGGSIAVVGCGPDVIYPKAHAHLHSSLVELGLVVSEYPPGTKPMPWRFPARNRIMAGLTDAVIVVEARAKSGALITADFCLDEGREVMAVPGSIFSDLSAGPHGLIRNGATAVTCAWDALESLGIDQAQQQLRVDADPSADACRRPCLTDEETRLLNALDGRPRHQDTLAASAGIDSARAAAVLVSLELRGHVRFEPGRGYSR